jgi:2-amino-4-hydroxy-6-hydroxymethyldihydropteridine diphosphokinase
LTTAYLSLGSNLGDRAANLRQALERLETVGVQILRRSSIYETAPQELREQPWFLNQVVEIATALSPIDLLARIREIERELGRQRVLAKGPRTIDIDILFCGDAIVDTTELQIPHPRLADRRFVLEPLAELAPDLRHPATRRTVSAMLAAIEGQTSKRWTG